MSSYKEETKVWTAVRTSSSFLGASPNSKKDNDTLTIRKESVRTMETPNRISAISSRTKSIENLSNGSPPTMPRAAEEKRASSSERNIPRRDLSMNTTMQLKATSASCIATTATTNYNYPVVNVLREDSSSTLRSSVQVNNNNNNNNADSQEEGPNKAQKREHLRAQRDNLNWDLYTSALGANPPLERKESITLWKPVLSKGADVEGLMNKVWNKQYKEAELYISIMGAQVETTRSLTTTEVTIKLKGKVLGTFPYGQEICLEIEDKPEGDLSLQIHANTRLNQRKKLGRCNIVLSKLEDGKAMETWYSFSKKKRKAVKSKGYLRVKVMWLSAVTRNKDFLMAKENYSDITSLLFDKEGIIVSALCRLYKEEDLAMALIRLFNSQKQTSYLLMNLMIREIYYSDDPATLFRNDSMATKTARIFFSMIGKSYLKRVILAFVAYVTCEIGKGNSYEVDPEKLKENQDELPANAARLIVAAKKFLGPILDSISELPLSVRLFFCNLSQVLKMRVKTGNPVGAMFFLRFLLPAALFPSQYDLMDRPLDPPVFRSMVLVTKILQNLVNGCVFHEAYMTMFNSFITDNIASVNAFFGNLCTLPTPPNIRYDDELEPYTDEQLVKLLSIIVRKLHMFYDKMQSQIECDPLFLTAKDKQHQLYLYAKLKTLFLERILTSETGDEAEMKRT